MMKAELKSMLYVYLCKSFSLFLCFFVTNNRHGKPKNAVYIEKKNVDNESKKKSHESKKDYAKKPYLTHNNVNCDSACNVTTQYNNEHKKKHTPYIHTHE